MTAALQRLAGKVANVTGAVSGIGCATAQLFAAEGANVLAAALQVGGCQLDILFNNAGVSYNALGELSTDAEWDRVFSVNIRAVFRLCRAAIPALRARVAVTGHGLVADGGLTLRT